MKEINNYDSAARAREIADKLKAIILRRMQENGIIAKEEEGCENIIEVPTIDKEGNKEDKVCKEKDHKSNKTKYIISIVCIIAVSFMVYFFIAKSKTQIYQNEYYVEIKSRGLPIIHNNTKCPSIKNGIYMVFKPFDGKWHDKEYNSSCCVECMNDEQIEFYKNQLSSLMVDSLIEYDNKKRKECFEYYVEATEYEYSYTDFIHECEYPVNRSFSKYALKNIGYKLNDDELEDMLEVDSIIYKDSLIYLSKSLCNKVSSYLREQNSY